MTELEQKLEELGFQRNEVKVYIALSELSRTRAGEVIKHTGIHRNLVYGALHALVQRGLITKYEGSVAEFELSDPQRLIENLQQKELTAQQVIEVIIEKQKIAKQEIRVIEGANQVRAYWLSLVRSLGREESISIITSGGSDFESVMGNAFPAYMRQFKQGKSIRILQHPSQSYSEKHQELLEKYNVEIRTLQSGSPPRASIGFAKDYLIYALYGESPTIIQIQNKELVKAYQNYFALLWDQTVGTQQGWKAFEASYHQELELLDAESEYLVIGANEGEGGEYKKFYDDYHKRRIAKGVNVRMLAHPQYIDSIVDRFKIRGDAGGKLSQVKSMKGRGRQILQTRIYSDKVVLETHGETPSLITISDETVVHGFRAYFEEMWEKDSFELFGKQGITWLLDLVLSEGKNLYLLYANGAVSERYKKAYAEFTKKRVEKNITIHMLATQKMNSEFKSLPQSSISYLPEGFESPVVVWIFGDYVANVAWFEPEKIWVVHDAKIADAYRKQFRALKDAINA